MPVRQPVAPLPPPDQGLHPAHLQPPPATWSPHDSRSLQPQGPHARRHHRRRRREAKVAGSLGEATREAEGPWDTLTSVWLRYRQEIMSFSLCLCSSSNSLFCPGHSFKDVKPKAPVCSSMSLICGVFKVQKRSFLKDSSAEVNLLLLWKTRWFLEEFLF